MERLKSHAAFVKVIKQRHKIVSRDVVVHYYLVPPAVNNDKQTIPQEAHLVEKACSSTGKHQQGIRQLGLAVSKKVGNAVVRNKVKRRFRVIAAQYEELLPQRCSLVLRARDTVARTSFEELSQQIQQAFGQIYTRSDEQFSNSSKVRD